MVPSSRRGSLIFTTRPGIMALFELVSNGKEIADTISRIRRIDLEYSLDRGRLFKVLFLFLKLRKSAFVLPEYLHIRFRKS